jgi:REP element-mobilizing transposase RayT
MSARDRGLRRHDVAQPPSAVSAAKSAKATYHRNLPHIQRPDKTLFITFSTHKRWELPSEARDLVLRHCVHDHGTRVTLHVAVIMPDHVHLLFTPLRDASGDYYGLAQIMGGIKGASAHSVNRLLKRRGPVWQDESFDHLLRSDEDIRTKAAYISANPVRAGLVSTIDEYRWVWREWVEGAAYG